MSFEYYFLEGIFRSFRNRQRMKLLNKLEKQIGLHFHLVKAHWELRKEIWTLQKMKRHNESIT